MNRYIFIVSLLFGLLVAPCFSQRHTDAVALLKRVAATYESMKSYHFEEDEDATTPGLNAISHDRSSKKIMYSRQGKYLRESWRTVDGHHIDVCDGEYTYNYDFSRNQYSKYKSGSPDLSRDIALSFTAYYYFVVDPDFKGAKVIGKASIMVGNTWRQCTIVQMDQPSSADLHENSMETRNSPITFWVDEKSLTVVRDSMSFSFQDKDPKAIIRNTKFCVVTSYRIAEVNIELPDSLFVIKIPKDAKEIRLQE